MPSQLSSLGEFGFIDSIRKYSNLSKDVFVGIGDDAAVLAYNRSQYLLLTTDMLIENVHFTQAMGARRIGHKALACNISDIAAMGGIPTQAVVSLGVPGSLSTQFAQDLYQGMNDIARAFNVSIVGGDTVRSAKITINVSLLGTVNKKDLVRRNGAQPGDQIFVTGPLGNSLKSGRHLDFVPRVKESQYLVSHTRPTAMLDISDGLAADLGHILKQSKVGAVIKAERIPLAQGASLKQALSDGEDFELLFTVSARNAQKLAKNPQFIHIGEIVRGKESTMVYPDGRKERLNLEGYRHF